MQLLATSAFVFSKKPQLKQIVIFSILKTCSTDFWNYRSIYSHMLYFQHIKSNPPHFPFNSPSFRMDSGFPHLASLLMLFRILCCTLYSLWSKVLQMHASFCFILLTCFLQKFFKIKAPFMFFTRFIGFKGKEH